MENHEENKEQKIGEKKIKKKTRKGKWRQRVCGKGGGAPGKLTQFK